MEPTSPISYVPTFDGKAPSFLDFEQRVILRNVSTEIPPEMRSTLLILHMGPAARQVCMFSGADTLMEGCDVMLVAQALRDYFQPDAVGRIFSRVEKFASGARADQTIEKFLAEFGILRRKAEKHIFASYALGRLS